LSKTKEIPETAESEAESEACLAGAGVDAGAGFAESGLIALECILARLDRAIFHEPWLVEGREIGAWLAVIARFWFVTGTECETGEMGETGEFWFLVNRVSFLARTEGPEIWVWEPGIAGLKCESCTPYRRPWV
jgi:hypothetical protein